MRSKYFVLLLLSVLIVLLSGCNFYNHTEKESKSMRYSFNEPYKFPFEVNEA